MDESLVGLLVFIAMAVVASLACHTAIRTFMTATLVSGPVAAIAFQVVVYFQLGYLDPFFPIALVVSSAIGCGISVAVGWLLRRARA